MNNEYEGYALPAIGFDQYYNTLIRDDHKNFYRNAWTQHQAALTAYKAALIEYQAKQAEYIAEMRKNLPRIAESKAQLAAYRAKHFPKSQKI